MSRRKIKAGSLSVNLPVFIQDTSSTTGAGLGNLQFNTVGLSGEYRREGQPTWTNFSLVSGVLGTWSSGGFINDGNNVVGRYELGLPNPVCATGATWANINLFGATNMLPMLVEIELDTIDYQVAGGILTTSINSGTIANIWNQQVDELTAIPQFPVTYGNMFKWLFERSHNLTKTTGSGDYVYKTNGITVLGSGQLFDDGTTFTRGAYI